jgi:uncharacterized protein YfiM (DUF2279 family)
MRFARILLVLALVSGSVGADTWTSRDKTAHLGLSVIGFHGSLLAFRNSSDPERRAAALTLGLGVLKELYDWKVRKSSFSERDLLFDLAGVLLALWVLQGNR